MCKFFRIILIYSPTMNTIAKALKTTGKIRTHRSARSDLVQRLGVILRRLSINYF